MDKRSRGRRAAVDPENLVASRDTEADRDDRRPAPGRVAAFAGLFFGGVTVVAFVDPGLGRAAQVLCLLALLFAGLLVALRLEQLNVAASRMRPGSRATRLLSAGAAAALAACCLGVAMTGPAGRESAATRRPDSSGHTASMRVPASSLTFDGISVDVGVANQTAGATEYSAATSASYDQVVKVELTYQNLTAADESVTPRLLPPRGPGAVETIGWDFTVGGQTKTLANVVRLDGTGSKLDYIAGSAVWKHDVGADQARPHVQEESLGDAQVLSPTRPLDTAGTAYQDAASVAAEFRVTVPGSSLTWVGARKRTDPLTSAPFVARAEPFYSRVVLQNTGNDKQFGVRLSLELPPGITVLPGSVRAGTEAANSRPTDPATTPTGSSVDGSLYGFNVGDLEPGESYVVVAEIVSSGADSRGGSSLTAASSTSDVDRVAHLTPTVEPS